MKKKSKPFILVDTREKPECRWMFEETKTFSGSKLIKLDNGDYSIEGLPLNYLYIDRKRSFYELLTNLFGRDDRHRFNDCLNRVSGFKHKFIIVEASFSELYYQKIPKMHVEPDALFSRIIEISLNHNISFIYAGNYGKVYCRKILEKIWNIYLNEKNTII